MSIKINYKEQQKKVTDYIAVLEEKNRLQADIADTRFFAVNAIHTMLKKVHDSKSSKESKDFWGRNLRILYHTSAFIDNLAKDNCDINRMSEHQSSVNEYLMMENNRLNSENEKLKAEYFKLAEDSRKKR